jgi:VIT1/CCC1 family predicted Fe2+/Mn2+ transporter
MRTIHEDYLRSGLFGLQDGLVSTTGVVVGISTGVQNKEIVILAVLVAVMVEASSMAAGQYSSEKAVHQMDKTGRHNDSLLVGSIIMFISYLLAGLIPISPLFLFNISDTRVISILFAFISLFIIGYVKGKIVEDKPIRSAIELFVIGALATGVGLIVGYFLKI